MKLRTVIATAATAALLATAGVALAGAASTSTPASSTSTAGPSASTAVTSAPKAATPAINRVRHRRLRVRALVRRVVVETIGIDRATLRRDLRGGQTIADIATAHQVDPKTVVDALVAAATTKLDAAASAAIITADRAQAIEARLPARFTRLVDTWHPRRFRNAAAGVRQ